jgi:hypothetical protein
MKPLGKSVPYCIRQETAKNPAKDQMWYPVDSSLQHLLSCSLYLSAFPTSIRCAQHKANHIPCCTHSFLRGPSHNTLSLLVSHSQLGGFQGDSPPNPPLSSQITSTWSQLASSLRVELISPCFPKHKLFIFSYVPGTPHSTGFLANSFTCSQERVSSGLLSTSLHSLPREQPQQPTILYHLQGNFSQTCS